ncbi:hypothetical protein FA09DRAFT_328009 [Tilletiopsis washingtonensis]|uniref:N-acetyltransferase domain-containing protein n=1 Tax=Tilletiopsis washingtonensis TaxID=58919 RepID=A0A316ZJR5_9BASI|nr:hypothetical protein FA09DRAFT_328009 [Tilletiopsis washingtonensis]PWO00596.1 hypothetical protein FA09DRAFT_328009 [Tilletiopsis washingtonensis]
MALAQPRRGLPGGGWLSMVPESDDRLVSPPQLPPPPPPPPVAPAASLLAPAAGTSTRDVCAAAAAALPYAPHASTSYTAAAALRTSGSSSRRGGAKFEVGAPDSSQCPTPSSGARSSDASPVPFDVRSSFAPLPRYGQGAGSALRPRAPALQAAAQRKRDTDDDGQGIEYAGRRWKGKTAHAVELEMEQLGDRTVMSYAPDAVYLASRLEGLKRNLEAQDWERKPRYLAWSDDEDEGAAEAKSKTHSPAAAAAEAPDLEDMALSDDDDDGDVDSVGAQGSPSPLHSPGGEEAPATAESKPSAAALRAMSNASTRTWRDADGHATADLLRASRGGLLRQHHAAHDELHTLEGSALVDESEEESLSEAPAPAPTTQAIDPAAKQAALDARLDIRMLRRPDLEQVRELHCLHGDVDAKVDFDSYTTSAGFLIRLLVDEKHICLVAVARPLPEPAAALPTGAALLPSCPPPSLDMPPSQSAYLLANRGIAAASPYLGGIAGGATPRRFSLAHGWGAPGTAGPGSSSNRSTNGNEASSLSSPPESASSTSPADPTAPQVRLHPAPATRAAPPASYAASHSSRLAPAAPPPSIDVSQVERSGAKVSPPAESSARHSNDDAYKNVLAGPTNAVAPPRAVRVMAAPPPGGLLNRDAETILGVASAHITSKAVPPSAGGGLWPGLEADAEPRMPHLEAHLITLAVAHSERGQGLGARLLDLLLKECKTRACALAAKPRRRGSDAHSDAHQPKLTAEALAALPMRVTLEVHASNASALALYESRGFTRVQGVRGTKPKYYQGDPRIPVAERLKIGGTDAWVLERTAP